MRRGGLVTAFAEAEALDAHTREQIENVYQKHALHRHASNLLLPTH